MKNGETIIFLSRLIIHLLVGIQVLVQALWCN